MKPPAVFGGVFVLSAKELTTLSNSLYHNNHKRKIALAFFIIYVFAICICLYTCSAYADTSTSDWNSGVSQAGKIISRLALALGAVGVAWCGIEYTYGSEEVARKAIAKAIAIVAATAAVYALPAVIRLGRDLGKQYGWSPSSLGK